LLFHDTVDTYTHSFAAILESLSSPFELLSVKPVLCVGDECPLLIHGKLVYHDGDHLSKYGASLLSPLFRPYMERLAAPPASPAT